jgi:hypothetical protein
MLRFKITKAKYDELDEPLKALYKADGDSFSLQVESHPEVSELTKQIKTLTADLDKKKSFVDPAEIPDAAAISRQLDEEREGRKTDVTRYQSLIAKTMIGEKAAEIAAKISKTPAVMKRFVSDSLTVDFTGDQPKIKVLDENGKPSDRSFDDLSKSLLENADYADIVIGSNATGGGGGKKTTTATPAKENEPLDLRRASGQDLVARVEAKLAAKSSGA